MLNLYPSIMKSWER